MNKRQKKKQVKQAIKNFVELKDSKRDKVIMSTIGTNRKVSKELLHSYYRYSLIKAYVAEVKKIIEPIFVSVKSAITSIAKELDMEPQELTEAANSLMRMYGITGTQAIDLIVKGHQIGSELPIEPVEEPEEMDAVTDQQYKDIHHSEEKHVLHADIGADSFYKPSMWEKLKEKVKGISSELFKTKELPNEDLENVNDSIR